MPDMKKASVMSEMQRVETVLQESMHRVEAIERKLRHRLLSQENRERLERELGDVNEALRINGESLNTLRRENARSFLVAAAIAFLCFLAYCLYCFARNAS